MALARKRGFHLLFTGASLMLMFGDTVISTAEATKESIQPAMLKIAESLDEELLPALHGDVPMPFDTDPLFKADCINKLKEGEPFFTLIGRDLLAPIGVRAWAQAAGGKGIIHKGDEAMQLAQKMDEWHPRKLPD